MAGRIVLSPLVADDLFDIWAFIAADNPGAARMRHGLGDLVHRCAAAGRPLSKL